MGVAPPLVSNRTARGADERPLGLPQPLRHTHRNRFTGNLPGRSPVKVRATRWEEPTYRIRSYGPGLHVPLPESRKVSPATGMNSHVYDPSASVNFSTPCTLALRTSLFGCTVPIP
jgi:hypothetical protein